MAFQINNEFDLQRIQDKFSISQKIIDNSSIQKNELKEIYENFCVSVSNLETIRREILTILNENLTERVHSIRSRIKDPDHLIEKIIRNVNSRPEKYSVLNMENYNKIITDLIGIRIIILDKRDWREVHKSLLQIFRNMPERYIRLPKDIIENYDKYENESCKKGKGLENSYHAEKPVVYITSEDDRQIYVDENLRMDNSKTHYRSIHYIIRYQCVYFEIQVRTLFEEGWLEFDHRIQYPYDQDNMKKREFAGILNSLAVAADRLIAFYEESDFIEPHVNKMQEKKQQELNTNADSENLSLESKIKMLF